MDTRKEMSVAIDIDDRLTDMEEIQEAAIPIDDQLIEMKEAAIPKDSQSAETTHGMTLKVKGELKTFVKKRLGELPGDEPSDDFYDPFGNTIIFRLPDHELKKELCEPKLVSIGPYHRGKPSLRTMEHHKWFMLRGFLRRNENVGFEVYLDAMKSLEPYARLRYSEPVDLESDDFALMLLLDGCFVLEWLFCFSNSNHCYRIFTKGWNLLEILYELCLMENQLPFFVLHTLLDIQDRGVEWRTALCKGEVEGQTCPLVELINDAFTSFNVFQTINFNPVDTTSYSCCHFGHMLHIYHLGVLSQIGPPEKIGRSQNLCRPDNIFSSDCFPCSKLFLKSSKAASASSPNAAYTQLKEVHIMCVSELCDAGVKFKKKKNPKHMLDISYEKGIIEIPFLKIDSHFVRMLWNLVAYEQTTIPNDSLSSYLALMDSFINTEKDVAILERAGIVDNCFSNAEEAAIYFNQFGKLFLLDYGIHYFSDLFQEIKEYGESTWPKYRAKLVQDYFSNPWTFISVVAAVVLFALTILQTYFSAIAV